MVEWQERAEQGAYKGYRGGEESSQKRHARADRAPMQNKFDGAESEHCLLRWCGDKAHAIHAIEV